MKATEGDEVQRFRSLEPFQAAWHEPILALIPPAHRKERDERGTARKGSHLGSVSRRPAHRTSKRLITRFCPSKPRQNPRPNRVLTSLLGNSERTFARIREILGLLLPLKSSISGYLSHKIATFQANIQGANGTIQANICRELRTPKTNISLDFRPFAAPQQKPAVFHAKSVAGKSPATG